MERPLTSVLSLAVPLRTPISRRLLRLSLFENTNNVRNLSIDANHMTWISRGLLTMLPEEPILNIEDEAFMTGNPSFG